jgi:predicted nucleic acid-binding protein
MIVVCDSSPVIALATLDALDLLDKLFEEVVIPHHVFDEMTIPGKPESVRIRLWAEGKVVESKDRLLMQAFNLTVDAGEAEAMSLYRERNADFLLIDEKKGRRIALHNHIQVIGSLGILLLSKQRGLLAAIKPLLDVLQQSHIRISHELYRKALTLAGE